MRAVLQRVTSARVEVDGEVVGAIDRAGLLALVDALRGRGVEVEQGRFGAMMEVSLVGDGPVSLVVDA